MTCQRIVTTNARGCMRCPFGALCEQCAASGSLSGTRDRAARVGPRDHPRRRSSTSRRDTWGVSWPRTPPTTRHRRPSRSEDQPRSQDADDAVPSASSTSCLDGRRGRRQTDGMSGQDTQTTRTGAEERATGEPRTSPRTSQSSDGRGALDVHLDDPASGHRLVTDELADRRRRARRNRVHRLCTEQRLFSVALARARSAPRARAVGARRPRRAGVHRGVPWFTDIRGSPTSPSTRPARASSTSARSRTPAPTAAPGTPPTAA